MLHLPAAFCPAAALTCQILWLYVSALLGLLKPGAYAAAALGLAALLYHLLGRRDGWREFLEPACVFFLLYGLFFALFNRELIPSGYDNYTHWAVIVKEMYLTDALPRPGTMVTFTNYPPAAALYEYYLLQFLGLGGRQMVLALNILGGAMLSCCLVGVRWSRGSVLLLRLGVILGAFLMIPEHFRNLYVDAILGFVLLAMGVMALWDDSFSGATAVPQALLGALLLLIKMSGAMLLVLHVGLLLLLKYRRGAPRPSVRPYLLSLAGVCAGAYLSFHLHVARVFGQAVSDNQFQLSLSNFTAKLQEKSADFWSVFPLNFVRVFFDRGYSCSRFFLLFNLLFFGLFLLVRLGKLRLPAGARGLIPFSWACAAFYILCLAAMYIFMMTQYEGSIVASYDRYFGTLMIYQFALPLTGLFWEGCGDLPGRRVPSAGLTALFLCAVIAAGRITLFPPRWVVDSRLNQVDANRRVFTAAEQVGELLASDHPAVLAGMDYGLMSTDLMYRVFCYAFWQRDIFPLIESRWDSFDKTQPFYLLWLDSSEYLETALSEAGLPVPRQPGLYRAGPDGRLSLIREILF